MSPKPVTPAKAGVQLSADSNARKRDSRLRGNDGLVYRGVRDDVMKANKHKGPTLDAFLQEEGINEELSIIVAKECIAFQLQQAMKKKRISKVKLAEMMDTSRTQIDRILDPTSGNITIETLQRVARIVGRELRVELV